MSAIDKIKNGIVMESSKWRIADKIILEAILELAERVEALEQKTAQSDNVQENRTKPSIDWSHVAPEYKWLARDEDGESWLYTSKPSCYDSCGEYDNVWVPETGVMASPELLASYQAGDCDWKNSLVERPEGE